MVRLLICWMSGCGLREREADLRGTIYDFFMNLEDIKVGEMNNAEYRKEQE